MKIEWVPKSTPVPNALLDEVMPKLRDTELRVVLVIVRQTLGWVDRETGKRRISDWISQGQLKKKTGRASEAISRSIDVLVRSRVIEVCDYLGRPLMSASARRKARHRVYYSLSKRLLQE